MDQKTGKRKITVYDTTLRDGAQGEGIHFSTRDKLSYVKRIDEFGSIYVEAGWPGANPKDEDFFRQAGKLNLSRVRLAAFGSTCKVNEAAKDSEILRKLLESGAPTITIFGKTWDLHVTDVLRTTLEENLRIIRDSVSYLISQGREVFYDAEHYFDGFKENPEYALKCIAAALEAGAHMVTVADHTTRNLVSPEVYDEFVKPLHRELNAEFPGKLILHCCGFTEDRVMYFAEAGFPLYHFESANDIDTMIRLAGGMKLTGNINNPGILLGGSREDVTSAVRNILMHGINMVSPECAVPLLTPDANLRAIVDCVKTCKICEKS